MICAKFVLHTVLRSIDLAQAKSANHSFHSTPVAPVQHAQGRHSAAAPGWQGALPGPRPVVSGRLYSSCKAPTFKPPRNPSFAATRRALKERSTMRFAIETPALGLAATELTSTGGFSPAVPKSAGAAPLPPPCQNASGTHLLRNGSSGRCRGV